MRLPRFILNPAVSGWIRLYQHERKENARLRRELQEWQNKFLAKVNVTPLFQSQPKIEPVTRPPVGLTEKRMHMAFQPPNAVPTAEQILEAAQRVS